MLSRIILGAVVAVGCARGSPRAEPLPLNSWTGCYAVTADSLPPVYRSTDWGLFTTYPLPDSLVLEASFLRRRESDERSQYKLRASYPPSVRRTQRIAFTWTPITQDSIEALVWADGFRAIVFELSRREGQLVGVATWGTDDMSAPTPSAPIHATSVSCSDAAHTWPRR